MSKTMDKIRLKQRLRDTTDRCMSIASTENEKRLVAILLKTCIEDCPGVMSVTGEAEPTVAVVTQLFLRLKALAENLNEDTAELCRTVGVRPEECGNLMQKLKDAYPE